MGGRYRNVEMMVALEEQVECYRRLEKLSQRQHEQVQQGSTEGLIEVLEQRQAVVSRIIELENELAPAKRQWKQDGSEHGRLRELLAESRMLLQKITEAALINSHFSLLSFSQYQANPCLV